MTQHSTFKCPYCDTTLTARPGKRAAVRAWHARRRAEREAEGQAAA